MTVIIKYPRTPHLEGSRLGHGDSPNDRRSLSSLADGDYVWEEKVDGANCAIRFSDESGLLLQSRGHFLTGGHRERQFNRFKAWANSNVDMLFDILSTRYIMYGEWCYAKHSIYYDALPHYFLEFDVYDVENASFLSTYARRELIGSSPISSVPVVWDGVLDDYREIVKLIAPSAFKTRDWRNVLRTTAVKQRLDPNLIESQSDSSDLMEGLYLKVERDGVVVDRAKLVRCSFQQAADPPDVDWHDRPIIPNRLSVQNDVGVSL